MQLGTHQFALDAHGTRNVAFSYWLTDGRRGIAMAEFIPEAATGGLLFCDAVSCGILGWRRLAGRC